MARYHSDADGEGFLRHWSDVHEASPWKHCKGPWQPPTDPEPTPTPRKFASLTRTITDFGHIIDAIDEDGVAWWMTPATHDSEPEWHQLTPLPGREVSA